MRTRKLRFVRSGRHSGRFWGHGLRCKLSLRAALSAVEHLVHADTAHFVRGYAPGGVPHNSERWAQSIMEIQV